MENFSWLAWIGAWFIGFGGGIAVAGIVRDRMQDKNILWMINYALDQEKDITRMLSQRVVEDDIKIKEQRWLLEGGIDGSQDLEDISEAKAGGDEYVETRAQALIEACRSLSMLNQSDGLQRGLESLGEWGLWK